MTLRLSHPRAKPRWFALGIVGAALMIMSAGLAYAAVFGDPADNPYVFALDGDALDPVLPDGDAARNLPDDWETIFPTAELPKGWLDKSFVDDHPAVDETYFTGGSTKDDIDIDTVAGDPGSGGWLRDKTSSAQPKADIIDAFAASYQVNNKTIVYFGMDRFSNDGATFAGFWFLQNAISYGPTANNGVGEINGSHEVGDILVITDFTQGGAVEKLNVYEWVGPDYAGPETVINGVFILKFAGTDCSKANSTDLACTIVSKGESVAPWPFTPKSNVGPDGKFQAGLLVEGGVNISDLFPGEDPCFTNFVAETRASFSVDSTLSDFTAGSFNTCGGIEALKYHDKNADGSRDANGADDVLGAPGAADDEVPLGGWTIFIDENGNETLDSGEQSAVTDAVTGQVTFSSLTTGAYSVCEKISDQTNWLNSDPTGTTLCKTANVGTGGAVVSLVFGNYQNATKSGVKFNDLDGDGVKDAGEPGLNGWEIHLFGTDGAGSSVHLHATTANVSGVDGVYSFSFAPGSYTVCETQQTGWTQSYPTSTTTGAVACPTHAAGGGTPAGAGAASGTGWSISLLSGISDTDNNFGNFQNATKSGVKFNDLDGDGVKDAGEPGLNGWEIHLFGTDGAGSAVHRHATTATVSAVDGAYSFSVPPGSYTVCETQQTGWTQSYPTTSTTGSVACPTHAAGGGTPVGVGAASGRGWGITLASGGSDTNNDFGNFQNATKSGVKFHDVNADGVQNAGEPGLNGWEIHLFGTDGAGNAVHRHATTATVSSVVGSYSFSVPPGSYVVCETQQDGWAQTYPSGSTTGSIACPPHAAGGGTPVGVGAASGRGWDITLTSGQVDSNNNFGNRELYRLIVLTCSEASGLLVQSTVDLDGAGTTYSAKDTIGTPPALSGKTVAELQAYLCNLGGAQYDDLAPQTFNSIQAIVPKPV